MLRHTVRQAQDFFVFKENVDSWIKDFNTQMQNVSLIAETVDENIENTNHNYELIQSLKQQLDAMQQEVRTIKLLQLLVLKRTTAVEKRIQ